MFSPSQRAVTTFRGLLLETSAHLLVASFFWYFQDTQRSVLEETFATLKIEARSLGPAAFPPSADGAPLLPRAEASSARRAGAARHLTALGEACLLLLPLSKRSQMSVCFLLLCAFQKTGEDQILVNISVPLFLSLLLSKEVGGGEGMFSSFRVGLKLAKPENSFISSPWGIEMVN